MMVELQTRGLPGLVGDEGEPMRWKLRPRQDGRELEIPMLRRGTQRAVPVRPEQAQWLAQEGFGQVDRRGRLPLAPGALHRLGEMLDPLVIGLPWGAVEALEALNRAVREGQVAVARQAAARLLSLAPAWEPGRQRRLFLFLYDLGDLPAAEAELDALPDGVIPTATRRAARMSIALIRHDYVAYERLFSEEVAAGLQTVEAWETLGLARWACGRVEDALATFQQGVQAHPTCADLRRRCAECLAELGRQEEALAAFEALMADEPDDARAVALHGWVQRAAQPDLARADFLRALELDPECAVARVGLGLEMLAAGDLAGARAHIEPFNHCGWQGAHDAWAAWVAAAAQRDEDGESAG